MVAHLLTASRAPGSAPDTGAEDAADCVGIISEVMYYGETSQGFQFY